MLKFSKYFLLFITGLLVITSGHVLADSKNKSKTVTITGTGSIVEEDTSSAKEKAISNSLVAAVESVLIETLPNNVVVPNFETITDILYSHKNTFIEGYKVLTETRHKNDYRVMVQATVSTRKILKKLSAAGIVLDTKNKHKILLLVSENNLQDIEPQYWWGQGKAYIRTVSDSTLTSELKKRGFEILSHRLVDKNVVTNESNAEPFSDKLTTDEVIALGVFFNADVVVSGMATAEQAQNTMGNDRTFTGSISLNIYRTDTGEKIDSVSAKETTVATDETTGGNEALIESAVTIASEIASTTNIAMKKETDKATMIEVVIEGTDFFKNYAKLIKRVSSLPDVKKITQREKRPKRSIVVIEHMGNGKTFAKKIMSETFENFGLNISEVTRNHVRLEMVPLGSSLFDR